MFDKLFMLLGKKNLIMQALNNAYQMLSLSRKLFKMAVEPIYKDEQFCHAPEVIFETDKEINEYEMKIRRKVLEHLSISEANPTDVPAALVLTTIISDIERLGDYSKNFYELANFYGKSIHETSMFPEVNAIFKKLKTMFDKCLVAFTESDTETALEVMDFHAEIAGECDKLIEDLLKSKKPEEGVCNSREDVLTALVARYMKRTSAHLKNIASSIVNPYDRIGYKPDSTEEYDD